MPTVRWEKRPKKMRYFYDSLERFDMMETLETFELVLLFQIVMERMRSRRSMMSTSRERRLKSAIVFAMVVLTIGYFEDDINRQRQTVINPASDSAIFHMPGSNLTFWENNLELFPIFAVSFWFSKTQKDAAAIGANIILKIYSLFSLSSLRKNFAIKPQKNHPKNSLNTLFH